jgi:hypothetical protein
VLEQALTDSSDSSDRGDRGDRRYPASPLPERGSVRYRQSAFRSSPRVLRYALTGTTRWSGHVYGPIKLAGYLIVLLMAVAVLYAAYISVTYWAGIGV